MFKSFRHIGSADNVIKLLESGITNWKMNSVLGMSPLGVINISQSIFHGDSLSSLLFVASLLPITFVLRKIKQGYSFGKGKVKDKSPAFYGRPEVVWLYWQ